MDSAWRADLFTFAMHRTVAVAYGAAKKRKAVINGSAEYVIINYDGVGIVSKDIADGNFDLIIADEATHYKNAQTKRWKILNALMTPEKWLWMMTGTPAAQSPVDAYGLAKLVNPTAVPRFAGSFKDQVMFKISNFRWVPKENATDTVFRVLQPAIRYTKEECLDLPDMVYVKREVELTRQQKKYYKVLREVIDESSKKVLIFVPFKHVIDLLVDQLKADDVTTEVIRGDVPVGKRTDIFKRFQTTDNPRVLVIQPQAAAHGITLTAANTVVWWGPTSSLETYAQANARVHRTGQDHKCTVVQLQGSTVEKHVYSMLDNRINIHTKITDLYHDILA